MMFPWAGCALEYDKVVKILLAYHGCIILLCISDSMRILTFGFCFVVSSVCCRLFCISCWCYCSHVQCSTAGMPSSSHLSPQFQHTLVDT
jgi:dolichyl-phosphate-mannose--protein O-mannosyl transferase